MLGTCVAMGLFVGLRNRHDVLGAVIVDAGFWAVVLLAGTAFYVLGVKLGTAHKPSRPRALLWVPLLIGTSLAFAALGSAL